MCIRRETREKTRRSLAFTPVSKPHTHITYMLRQCTGIVYILFSLKQNIDVYSKTNKCLTCRTHLVIDKCYIYIYIYIYNLKQTVGVYLSCADGCVLLILNSL